MYIFEGGVIFRVYSNQLGFFFLFNDSLSVVDISRNKNDYPLFMKKVNHAYIKSNNKLDYTEK